MADLAHRFTPLSHIKSVGNARGLAWVLTPLERNEFF